MRVFLNWRGPAGRETVDEFTAGEDAPAEPRAFRRYVRDMVREYHAVGMAVYTSRRACRGWA